MGSTKFHQRSAVPDQAPSKPTRAVRAIHIEGGSGISESESSGSDTEVDQRHIFAAIASDQSTKQREYRDQQDGINRRDQQNVIGQGKSHDRINSPKACTHCGSSKHDDRGCWKRLTCQKCGRKGHPSDKCFFVCSACGNIHEGGKCPMEEFYNLIRQWYVPTKHAGILPPKAEKMLH